MRLTKTSRRRFYSTKQVERNGRDQRKSATLQNKLRRRYETDEDRWKMLLHDGPLHSPYVSILSSKIKRFCSHRSDADHSVTHCDAETPTRKRGDLSFLYSIQQRRNTEQHFVGK